MTQASPTIGANKSGLTYRQEDNDGKRAILNHHKGSGAPAYAEAGMIWIDDTATPWLMKFYDGADWIAIGAINASTNAFQPYLGTAALKLLSHASDTGSANAYAVAPVPAITAYAAGMIVTLKPLNGSTGSSTLAVSGLATKTIKMPDGSSNLPSGAMSANGIYILVYDGTNFILTNPVVSADFLKAQGTTIASSATTDIGAADSDYVDISGTTTITSLGTTTTRNHLWLKFQGVLTLTHNATSLILPTAANITTAAGDVAEFVRLSGGNWKCLGYQRASGNPVNAGTAANQAVVLDGSARLPAVDGSQLTNLPGGGVAADLVNNAIFFDDFLYVANRTPALPADFWSVALSGGTATCMDSSADSAMGILKLSTSTSSTGAAQAERACTFRTGSGTFDFSARMKTPVISDSSQRFRIQAGMMTSSTVAPSDPGDGIFFRLVDNLNSGNWQCVCRKNSTETVINTSVAASTSYVLLRATVNAAASSVEFFINGASQGTTTTNIPSGSGDEMSPQISIGKSVGTTARDLYADYFYMKTQRI